jgi:hypothetical protein
MCIENVECQNYPILRPAGCRSKLILRRSWPQKKQDRRPPP